MTNNAILDNCRKRKNISTVWIHHKKVFDSIPPFWIIKCLKLYRVYPMLTKLIESSMGKEKTNMTLVYNQNTPKTGSIKIKRGISQADSLSPLHLVSQPTQERTPKETGYGYQLDELTKISHLFYVDALSCMEQMTTS